MRTARFLILTLSLLFTGCPEETVVTPVNSLQISVKDVGCTDALLLITVGSQEKDRTVSLKRGDSVIAVITMAGVDSQFTDTGILPNRSYSYTLTNQSFTASTSLTTPDTTSHAVQWALPDTLGAMGVIRDVWVFSNNDAWAVGEIYVADSTGKPDMANPYNAAHWDGTKWTLLKIRTRDFGAGSGYYPLYSVFGFSSNNIWFTNAADFIHWDGNSFSSKAFFMLQIPFVGQVNKIWGTSGNNLYCVGRTGSIYHYTGSGAWTKQQSNTTVDLQDIWGIDESHVWATGTNTKDGHSVVLQYNGTAWSTIYDNTNKPPTAFYGFNTVWTDRIDRVFLAGGSKTKVLNLRNNTFSEPNIPASWAAFQIRGRNQQDVFEARGGNEITHFNGVRWHRYSNLNSFINENTSFTSIHMTKDFIITGGFVFKDINGFPIVIRGYR